LLASSVDLAPIAIIIVDAAGRVAVTSQPIHRVLNGESDHLVLRLSATNRRGKLFDLEVEISPLRESATGKIGGVVLLMGEHNLPATVPSENGG
jgi:hypothetical protein